MKKLTRREIKKLRKNYTLAEIGKMFNPKITAERVRQIEKGEVKKFCKVHRIKYIPSNGESLCKYCLIIKTYSDFLLKHISKRVFFGISSSKEYYTLLDKLRFEFRRLSKKSKDKELILQKIILVKYMKNELNFSFQETAKLLERDYTTIINLYKKKII